MPILKKLSLFLHSVEPWNFWTEARQRNFHHLELLLMFNFPFQTIFNVVFINVVIPRSFHLLFLFFISESILSRLKFSPKEFLELRVIAYLWISWVNVLLLHVLSWSRLLQQINTNCVHNFCFLLFLKLNLVSLVKGWPL